ncbi:hypothetical protein ES703_17722 [subsurface metagenome]
MAEERTLVLLEDIAVTDRMEAEARRLGGAMVGKETAEQSALFAFPSRGAASDFMFFARRQGHQASIERAMFPGIFEPLEALREDAKRIRQALKKPPLRPPWAT